MKSETFDRHLKREGKIMERMPYSSSEKTILHNQLNSGLVLSAEVMQFQPANIPNPIPETRIGRYRSLRDRSCIFSQLEINKRCYELGQDPPSFLEAGPREKLYFDPEDVRVGILTAGGIAPGLNTVVHCITHMHEEFYGTRNIFGIRGGYRGLAEASTRDDLIRLSSDATKTWIHKGGTELGTSRGKQGVSEMAESLRDLGINILYVVGGDGSLSCAHLLATEIGQKDVKVQGKGIVIAGVPKTMDNDILWVWQSFGFQTAVEEATRAINAMYEDTKSAERICLMQLFGRDAGFVAANASLASGVVNVVLVPEVNFKITPLLDHVEKLLHDQNYALLVVAEGASPKEYTDDYILDKLKTADFNPYDPDNRTNPRVNEALAEGKLTFLKDKFEERFVHGTVETSPFRDGRHRVLLSQPRHLIRSVPPNSFDQIYCQRLSDLVVHNALAGFTDFMISQWLTEYVLVPLTLVSEQVDSSNNKLKKEIPSEGFFWTTVTNSTQQPSFE